MMKKRFLRLFLPAILIMSLLTACNNPFKTADLEDWDDFTEDFFREALSSDALTMHYFVEHPEDFGIEDYEDTLGTLYSEETEEDEYTWASDAIDEVSAYKDSSLDEQQKKDKETLLWYLETEQMAEDEKFAYYQELAAPMYGVQSNIPINFANYVFVEEEDIEHYLNLLDDVPRYMEELFLYEKERANRGYGMTDYLIDEVIEDCRDFLGDSLEENVLVTSFDERIEEFGLNDDKAKAYSESNLEKVRDSVFPAYETFMEEMETLKGTSQGRASLPEFEYGKEYYEYLARSAASSERTVDEMKELLNKYIDQQYTDLYSILMEDYDLIDAMDDPNYGAEEPEEILELIASRMGGVLVPDIGAADYTVKYVPKSLEGSSNPAFCFIPQIDNIQSTIYFNQSPEYENMDFYITVAHEGYPGHMYQNTYYYNTDPAHFRHILDFSGYTEGWAVYISYKALNLSDIDNESLCDLLAMNEAIGYEMSALADIGVNYDGWTVEELGDFFADWGMDDETVEDLYNQLISTPATYLSYSVAACEFWELESYAKEKMGDDYNDVDFHEIILKEGPTSFPILKERVDEYVAAK